MVNRFFMLLTFACLMTGIAYAEPPPAGDTPVTGTTIEAPTTTNTPTTPTTVTAPATAETTGATAEGTETTVVKAEAKADEAKADEAKAEAKPAEPETASEAWAIGKMMIEAFKSKNWGLAVGLLLMLLVFVLRKTPVLAKVPTKAMPWVAAALGIVGSVSTGLASGVLWYEALIHGVFLGAAATGLWEMIFKHVGKKAPAAE
jgi:hypothetical protein